MDQAIRVFFRAERRRLKLSQTKVAEKAGIEQGTISKIEINPDYEPGFNTFRQAVAGLGMTLSKFFAQIEGQTVNLELSSAFHSQRRIPPLLEEDAASMIVPFRPRPQKRLDIQLKTILAVGETIASSITRATESIERTIERSVNARRQTPHAGTDASVRRRRR
jgi:transcriptional regulator with XRE-family HTH domain